MILVSGWRRTLQRSLVLEVCRNSIAEDPCHLRTVENPETVDHGFARFTRTGSRWPWSDLKRMAFANHFSTRFLGPNTEGARNPEARGSNHRKLWSLSGSLASPIMSTFLQYLRYPKSDSWRITWKRRERFYFLVISNPILSRLVLFPAFGKVSIRRFARSCLTLATVIDEGGCRLAMSTL
jgi:hypothetical protein